MSKVDDLKKLINDTQNEVAAQGNCFLFFHKWSRWSGTADHQSRYCLRCSKKEELNKECKHSWLKLTGQTYNHTEGNLVKATEHNYQCSKCSLHKRVISPIVGNIKVEYY